MQDAVRVMGVQLCEQEVEFRSLRAVHTVISTNSPIVALVVLFGTAVPLSSRFMYVMLLHVVESWPVIQESRKCVCVCVCACVCVRVCVCVLSNLN